MISRRTAASPEGLPAWIDPMLAVPSAELPRNQSAYGFELKWDGFRAITYVAAGRVQVRSRRQQDYTARLPSLRELGSALGSRSAVLDGELVALVAGGQTDFQELQNHIGPRGMRSGEPGAGQVVYLIFDLLHLDGRSLLGEPYRRRREELEFLGLAGPTWWSPPNQLGDGAQLLEQARRLGCDGVVAKRLESRYRPGERSRDWLKVKVMRRQEFVIVGWLPGEGTRAGRIGALLLGLNQADGSAGSGQKRPHLVYAGRVGTGFSERLLQELGARLRDLATDRSPLAQVGPIPPGALFVRPELVCEVAFSEWTRAGEIRHPSFKGLRSDKAPAEVVREPPG